MALRVGGDILRGEPVLGADRAIAGPVLADDGALGVGKPRVVRAKTHAVRAGEEQGGWPARSFAAQYICQRGFGGGFAQQRLHGKALALAQGLGLRGALAERGGQLPREQLRGAIELMAGGEQCDPAPRGHAGHRLIRSHAVRVAAKVRQLRKIQPSHRPVQVQRVLEGKRDLVRRPYQHEIVGHAQGRVDDVERDPVTRQPGSRAFAGQAAIGALEHRDLSRLAVPPGDQRRERVQVWRRIHVGRKQQAPAGLVELVAVDIAQHGVGLGLPGFFRGALRCAAQSVLMRGEFGDSLRIDAG